MLPLAATYVRVCATPGKMMHKIDILEMKTKTNNTSKNDKKKKNLSVALDTGLRRLAFALSITIVKLRRREKKMRKII